MSLLSRWENRRKRGAVPADAPKTKRRTTAPALAPPPPSENQQLWLWVTKPEFYLDEDGQDRADLEPAVGADAEGWWTCHKDTRSDDLALIYRAGVRKDIAYLVRVESDAFELEPDEAIGNNRFACEYAVIAKFAHPLSIADMRDDPHLKTWGALNKSFIGATHRVPVEIWQHLIARLQERPEDVDRKIQRRRDQDRTETQLEDLIVEDVQAWRRLARPLDLRYRQYTFENGRIADLIYADAADSTLVVVELKRGIVNCNAVSQLVGYLNSADPELSPARPSRGILVGAELDPRAKQLLTRLPEVEFVSLHELLPDLDDKPTVQTEPPVPSASASVGPTRR